MKPTKLILTVALLTGLGASGLGAGQSTSQAMANCDIADTRLEQAIAQKPEFRAPGNRQMVRDLRSLRDAAFILWSYGRHEDCNRLMANIRELHFAPAMGSLGGSDEDEVSYQSAASADPPSQCHSGARQLLSADFRGGRADCSPDAGPVLRVAFRCGLAGAE